MEVSAHGARPDQDLEALAASGDRLAFAELYDRHFNRVYDFLHRIVGDADEAADLAQETFLRALRALSPKEKRAAFSTWLFTIARNLALNRLGRRRRIISDEGREEDESLIYRQADPDRFADPQAAAEAKELSGLVWQAASALSPKEYTLLDLNLRQGLDSGEIAQVLGVSKGNAYTMISRLKDNLESAVAALQLLQRGRKECNELNRLLEDHRITLISPDARRVIDRHVAQCPTCQEQRRRLVSPSAIFGSFAAIPVPFGLKPRIAEAMMGYWKEAGTEVAGGLKRLLSQSIDKVGSLSTAWKAAIIAGLLTGVVGGGLSGWVGVGGSLPFVHDSGQSSAVAPAFVNPASRASTIPTATPTPMATPTVLPAAPTVTPTVPPTAPAVRPVPAEGIPTRSTLFGLVKNRSQEHWLATVDPSNGTLSAASGLVPGIEALWAVSALDPDNHQFFFVGNRFEPITRHLIVLDTQTGAVLADPTLPDAQVPIALEFDTTTDTLLGIVKDTSYEEPAEYIENAPQDHWLATVDPSTGTLNPVGGIIAGFIPYQGLSALDPDNHRFFYLGIDPFGLLHLIVLDTRTGAVLADPTLPGPQVLIALEFDPTTDTLLGIVKDTSYEEISVPVQYAPQDHWLATVDPSTGALNPVGGIIAGFDPGLSVSALDPGNHRFFYTGIDPIGGLHLIILDTRTGAVLADPVNDEILYTLEF